MIHIVITILVLIIFLLVAVIHGLSEAIREEDERNKEFYNRIRREYDIQISELKKDNEVLEDILGGYELLKKEGVWTTK